MKFDVPPIVIDKLFNNGYEEQVIDIIMANNNRDDRGVSDIPLSPILMGVSNDKVIISTKVYYTYIQFVNRISNSETAQEIPFLLGDRKDIDGESYIVIEDIIFNLDNAKSETYVTADEETFRKLMTDEQYSVISIGHTHGNVSEELKTKSLARMLPDDINQKYDIRDTGLNISIADIWQHEAFIQIAKELSPTKEIMQTIIMYNGDMIMISPSNITKANAIQAVLQDGSYQVIPSGSKKQYTSKQI